MIKISLLIALLTHLLCTRTVISAQVVQREISLNDCGITAYYTDDTNRLIVNGDTALPGQWPWMVAIYVLDPHEVFKCSGTILTTRYIITAAHCLTKFLLNTTINPDQIVVVFGPHNSRQWTNKTTNQKVENYTLHPDVSYTVSADSDLAILSLSSPVEYNAFIMPVCLWSGSIAFEDVVNRLGYAVGWGQNDFGGDYIQEPRMAKMRIISQENCNKSDRRVSQVISDRTFCAYLPGERNSYIADEGSGLVLFDDITGRYQLRGIVSRAMRNYRLNYVRQYIIFIDVAKYEPWIREQISKHEYYDINIK